MPLTPLEHLSDRDLLIRAVTMLDGLELKVDENEARRVRENREFDERIKTLERLKVLIYAAAIATLGSGAAVIHNITMGLLK